MEKYMFLLYRLMIVFGILGFLSLGSMEPTKKRPFEEPIGQSPLKKTFLGQQTGELTLIGNDKIPVTIPSDIVQYYDYLKATVESTMRETREGILLPAFSNRELTNVVLLLSRYKELKELQTTDDQIIQELFGYISKFEGIENYAVELFRLLQMWQMPIPLINALAYYVINTLDINSFFPQHYVKQLFSPQEELLLLNQLNHSTYVDLANAAQTRAQLGAILAWVQWLSNSSPIKNDSLLATQFQEILDKLTTYLAHNCLPILRVWPQFTARMESPNYEKIAEILYKKLMDQEEIKNIFSTKIKQFPVSPKAAGRTVENQNLVTFPIDEELMLVVQKNLGVVALLNTKTLQVISYNRSSALGTIYEVLKMDAQTFLLIGKQYIIALNFKMGSRFFYNLPQIDFFKNNVGNINYKRLSNTAILAYSNNEGVIIKPFANTYKLINFPSETFQILNDHEIIYLDSANDNTIVVWDIYKQAIAREFKYPENYKALYGDTFHGLPQLIDESHIIFPCWQTEEDETGKLIVLNTLNGTIEHDIEIEGPGDYESMLYLGNNIFYLFDWHFNSFINVQTGQTLAKYGGKSIWSVDTYNPETFSYIVLNNNIIAYIIDNHIADTDVTLEVRDLSKNGELITTKKMNGASFADGESLFKFFKINEYQFIMTNQFEDEDDKNNEKVFLVSIPLTIGKLLTLLQEFLAQQ